MTTKYIYIIDISQQCSLAPDHHIWQQNIFMIDIWKQFAGRDINPPPLPHYRPPLSLCIYDSQIYLW